MNIDRALRDFTEKYSRDAIMSINDISNNIGLVKNNHTLKGFNINESIDQFQSFVKGYGKYREVYKESAEASDIETISRDFNNSLPKFFEDRDIKYAELPTFVESYINGIKSIIETVDTVKQNMIENDIQLEYVGAVNDFVDTYFAKLQESFDATMDRMLWASGYNARQRLAEQRVNKPVSDERPVFL